MDLRHSLLHSLLRETPFQPATSWWRSIELAVVVEHGLPRGAGLDLGCGDGKLMRILLDASRAQVSLVGVDIDPLETAAALASGVYQRVHTVPGERIPEGDGIFDFVFSNSVLEHIDDIEPVIGEVARVLRADGRFLFTVPGEQFHDCLAGPLAPWSDRHRYLETIDRRCAHRRYWGEADWSACLGRHSMEIAHSRGYLSAPEVRRWETLSRFTAGILYALAGERLQPIEIQRALGVRRRGLQLPGWAAAALSAALGAGAGSAHDGPYGCLLVEARKRP